MSTDALTRACEDGSFCHDMAFEIAAERDSLKRALAIAIHEQGQQFKLREAVEAELAKTTVLKICGCGDGRPIVEFCHLCGNCQIGCCDCISTAHYHRMEIELAKARETALELLEALQNIKDKEGKVCEEFELCTHISCASSYSAWAYADEAITKAKAGEKGE
jgi:hypothetical protein